MQKWFEMHARVFKKSDELNSPKTCQKIPRCSEEIRHSGYMAFQYGFAKDGFPKHSKDVRRRACVYSGGGHGTQQDNQ